MPKNKKNSSKSQGSFNWSILFFAIKILAGNDIDDIDSILKDIEVNEAAKKHKGGKIKGLKWSPIYFTK